MAIIKKLKTVEDVKNLPKRNMFIFLATSVRGRFDLDTKMAHPEKNLMLKLKYGYGSVMRRGCFTSKGPRKLFRCFGLHQLTDIK